MSQFTCDFCGKDLAWMGLCKNCRILKQHALILAKEVALLTRKGGVQLYIGIERTGAQKELLSVVRWSPLEPLESADSVVELLPTSL